MTKKQNLQNAMENAWMALYEYQTTVKDDEEMMTIITNLKDAMDAMTIALAEED